MRPKERDLAYLWDMREEARQITGFIKDVLYIKFVDNKMIRYAVLIKEMGDHPIG